MKKFLSFIILIFSINAFAEIIQTDNLNDVRIKYESILKIYKPNQILIIFGIDNTLLYSKEPSLQITDENLKPLIKKIMLQIKRENADYLKEIILTNYQHSLVDNALPKFIKEIASKNIPIIGLSTTLTGNINQISRLEVWIADYLKKYDIDFSESFSGNKDFVFKNFKEYKGTYPAYYNGIISTNSKYSKAQIILNFLLQLKFTPKAIIVIDQDINAIKGLEQQLKSYNKNIGFTGFYYDAVSKLKFNEISDQQFVNFWSTLISKLNQVKRSTQQTNSKADPYAN